MEGWSDERIKAHFGMAIIPPGTHYLFDLLWNKKYRLAWKPKLSAIPLLFKEVTGDHAVEYNEEALERIAKAVQ
jgi:hypothetical protein